MPSIWFAKEGKVQAGDPIAQKPVDWCVKNLGLQPGNWIADLGQTNLTIGEKTPLGTFADYRFVVVEIDNDDVRAGAKGWNTGFYLLEMNPRDARRVIDTVP
jgi:hypothetical protein